MDGIILINKEKKCTSHDVVYKIKKIFNEKVGHTGTLDPNATGVLPILIGKGTKLSQYLINHNKKYIATIKLGEKTDSQDSEGKVLKKMEVPESALLKENVLRVFSKYVGIQEQVPPIYSAIKVKGKKLYEYARNGQTVDVQPRQIEIYYINLISINIYNKEITFEVSCSKGTYIRSLCQDIAESLNTVRLYEKIKPN